MDSPAGWVGLGLVIGGLLFLALDAVSATGVLGLLGAAALVAGAVMVFDDQPAEWEAWPVAVAVVAVVLLAGSFALTVVRVRRMGERAESDAIIGKVVEARTALAPAGVVVVRGERWQARMANGSATPGDRLRVIGAEGKTLTVRAETANSPG